MNVTAALLGDIANFKGGGTPSRSVDEYWNGKIPWATVKDFKDRTLINETIESISEKGLSNSASNLIKAGTIVIPTRMALGKAAITGCDLAINQDLKAVQHSNEIDTQYLLRFFLYNSRLIEGMGRGATVKGITLDQLKRLKIPLPPIEEQQRIAAILDKADELRQKRRQASTKLDEFLQAVFLDMFGDPMTNPKSLRKGSIASLCKLNPRTTAVVNDDDEVTFVPMAAVSSLEKSIAKFELKSYGLVKTGFTQFERGDILVAKITPCFENGKFAFAREIPTHAAAGSTEFHVIRPPSEDMGYAIFQMLQLPFVIEHGKIKMKGAAGQRRVPIEFIRALPVLVADKQIHNEFSTIAKRVSAQKILVSRETEKLDILFQSLQKRAFNGTL